MTQVKSRLAKGLSAFLAAVLMLTALPGGLLRASAATNYSWQSIGSAGFSADEADFNSLYVYNGIPYVAYQDTGHSGKATVMKYDSSTGSWSTVGSAGFSAGEADYISLYVYNGTPYVAYEDIGNSYRATVMKYDGAGWVDVGSEGFSAGAAQYTSLYVSGGTPYVAYQDVGNSNKATVMKYDGTGWVNVGNTGFSANTVNFMSLYVYSGTPYVAYQDTGDYNKATVMKYNGTGWVNVGSAGFSADWAANTSLYVSDGTPYVAYMDGGHSKKATVMKYDGTGWVNVGSVGFSAGEADNTSLYVYNGTPYVAYADGGHSYKATVMKYDGTGWVDVGSAGFSVGDAGDTSLYVYNGTPYVAYQDDGHSDKATVTAYSPDAPTLTAAQTSVAAGGTIAATNSDGGAVYLVPAGGSYTTQADLQSHAVASAVNAADTAAYITIPADTAPGDYWVCAASSVSGLLSAKTDVTIMATVTFDKNGGDTSASPSDATISAVGTVALPATQPTRSGYVFAGWNTAKDGSGSTFTSSTAVTKSITVYAQWSVTGGATNNAATVTFDKNGGDTAASPSAVTISAVGTVALPATQPTRSGYALAGWNTAKDGSGSAFTSSTAVTKSITVYAQWSAIGGATNNATSGTVPNPKTGSKDMPIIPWALLGSGATAVAVVTRKRAKYRVRE